MPSRPSMTGTGPVARPGARLTAKLRARLAGRLGARQRASLAVYHQVAPQKTITTATMNTKRRAARTNDCTRTHLYVHFLFIFLFFIFIFFHIDLFPTTAYIHREPTYPVSPATVSHTTAHSYLHLCTRTHHYISDLIQ